MDDRVNKNMPWFQQGMFYFSDFSGGKIKLKPGQKSALWFE